MSEIDWKPDPRLTHLLSSLLPLESAEVVIEVGCGPGILSLWLAEKVHPRGHVIAVDLNPALLEMASNRARTLNVNNISFRRGDVYNLPFSPEEADIVVCQSLLCSLTEAEKAVREMCNLVKAGGVLAAIEPASTQVFYDPDDVRYAYLSEKLNKAFQRAWKARGADQGIGLAVPSLFRKADLAQLTCDAVVQVHLLGDHRRGPEKILQQLQTEASELPEETKRMLIGGGMPKKDLREFHSRAKSRLARYSADPAKAAVSNYVRLNTPLVVTVGNKRP